MSDDELDDLFGAIDGEEKGDDNEGKLPPAPKKGKTGQQENNGAPKCNNDNDVMDTATETAEAANTKDEPSSANTSPSKNNETDTSKNSTDNDASSTKQVYTTVMSAQTKSKIKQEGTTDNDATTGETSNKQSKKQQNATIRTENREIATGTSHDKSVRSYSAYPKNLPEGHEAPKVTPPTKPAKEYPFELDPFQAQAIGYIDKEESVLVAAHTSAGKTAVAEYAIAKSLNNGQRVVYTSPIKALSNQKFRDLQEEFEDVGLMTGDITINPDATCTVMTTEILRSMLYRGSELMREVAWVIYDEVHYMRDSERGVVWEESIILLPHRVHFVFLSATIPNANQFADWIAHIHHQPCHVVYTNYRPTPLQHYIFPQGGQGLHLVVDERGKFRENNFQRAMAALQSGNIDVASAESLLDSGNGKKRKRGRSGGKKGGGGQFNDLHRIVKLIMDRNLNPVIVFSFSKKDCERFALALNREDFTDDVEKDLITQVYTNAIESLSDDDRKLPQVQALLPLLKRGIGIHHGGLLPILKEIVEILFSEGLIKALFATETFSIGINMPAKTVVFTNTRKWDGKDFRWVTSGEYIQMSGRAGRRGKDDRGIVIQMLDEKMEPSVCKGILYGDPDPLNSSYRISYNMLLNLMRVEDVEPEYLLRASFHQFQRELEAPALVAQAEELENEASNVELQSKEETDLASEYYQMDQQLGLTKQKMSKIIRKPEYIVQFLNNSGRFLDITIEGNNYGWGALVNMKKALGTGAGGDAGRLASQSSVPTYTLEVLLPCVDRYFDTAKGKDCTEDLGQISVLWRGSAQHCRPVKNGVDNDEIVTTRVFTVGLENIERISAIRISIPQAVRTAESRKRIYQSIKEVLKRFPNGVQLLDPIEDMGIKEDTFKTLVTRAEALAKRLAEHKLATDFPEEDRSRMVEAYEKKTDLVARAKLLREEAKSCQTMAMKDDLKKMKRVLKKLGHVDANGVIQTKGRTACEINTANELVVVELIFTGVFKSLNVEQCVSLMSAMTFDERNKDEDDPMKGLKSFLANPFIKLQEVARTVAKVQIACNMELDEDEFVDKFNPGMMEAVFAWCKGVKFLEVQKLTGSFEGTTIRTLRRLEELVRQITNAAKAIGDRDLESKFEKGSELIRRDIVFCSSLYL